MKEDLKLPTNLLTIRYVWGMILMIYPAYGTTPAKRNVLEMKLKKEEIAIYYCVFEKPTHKLL